MACSLTRCPGPAARNATITTLVVMQTEIQHRTFKSYVTPKAANSIYSIRCIIHEWLFHSATLDTIDGPWNYVECGHTIWLDLSHTAPGLVLRLPTKNVLEGPGCNSSFMFFLCPGASMWQDHTGSRNVEISTRHKSNRFRWSRSKWFTLAESTEVGRETGHWIMHWTAGTWVSHWQDIDGTRIFPAYMFIDYLYIMCI